MKPVLAFLVLLSLFCAGNADNITKILNGFSDYSIFNSYLSQTKLADEINSRSTITVLALNNGAMSALTSKRLGLSVIKKVLSLHVLLDYFDGQKLHEISNGTMISTTLYQTSGNAVGKSGFLNITVLKGGKVAFGAAATAGAKLDSMFVKSIKEDPYNMSVLEISNAIMPSDLSTAPAPSPNDINITALLEKAGCKIFVQMITATGVLKTYQDALAKGFTLFAPTDGAFTGTLMPKFKKLSSAQEVSILEYHALPSYNPLGTLKTTSAPITTLATNQASIFFEILHQFGELQPEIEQKQKYAVWKAAEIRKAIKEGRRPEPGPPGGDENLSVPSLEGDKSFEQILPDNSQAAKPKDSQKLVRDAGTEQGPPTQFPRSVHHYSADEMGTTPAFSAPGYQTTAVQSPTFSPPDYQTTAVHGSQFQTPQDFSEFSQGSPIAYAPSYYTMPATLQDTHTGQLGASYPYSSTTSSHDNVNSCRLNHSFSTVHDASLDSQSGSHGSYPSNASYYQNTNGSHSGTVPFHLNSQPNPDYQPNTLVTGTNGAYGGRRQPEHISTVPEAAPAVAYSYDRNYQPPPEKIAEAHKAAKLAIGSLAFDDVPAAVDYLKRSLELLTLPSSN